MKKTTLIMLCFSLSITTLFSQSIFDDSIHTAANFGSVNSPGAEGVQNVIDQNSNTKFLDFNAADGIGFDVDILGVPKTAIAMEFVTANDAPERDPTNYEVFGSNDGTAYTSIATGTIPCISTRFFSRTFSFANTTAYTFFRVNFTGTCGTSNINQIADVQLYESIGDVPVFNCPTDITIANDAGICGGTANFTVTANDTEDGAITPTLVSGLASGSVFPIGTTPILYSAMDTDGNIVSCAFNVTVNDSENPTATCPADMTVLVNSGDTGAIVNYTTTDSDNCSTISPIAGFTSLATVNGKSYYLSNATFTPLAAFADAASQGGSVGTVRNVSENDFIVNSVAANGGATDVLIGYNDVDVEGSFIWDSGDASTYANWNPGEPNNAGGEDYTVLQSSGGWNDVLGSAGPYLYILEIDYAPTQTAGLPSGSMFPLGDTINTFEVSDAAGNTMTCSFTVTIDDSLSVTDFDLENGILITSNPVENILTVENKSQLPLENAVIYDLNGRQINTISLESNSGNHTINTSGLRSGLYIIKFTATNKNSTVKRFIKK